jgi:hypothetical protein
MIASSSVSEADIGSRCARMARVAAACHVPLFQFASRASGADACARVRPRPRPRPTPSADRAAAYGGTAARTGRARVTKNKEKVREIAARSTTEFDKNVERRM